jgi:transcriptional regulator with XRE-family HTH domain
MKRKIAQKQLALKQLKLLGQKIREFRHVRQFSQEELAARSNIHVTYLSALECGKRNASLAIFFSIASALRVTPADLLQSLPRGKKSAL